MARKTIRQGTGSKANPDADVKFLQSFLGTTADGIFGPGTTSLTKAYQKKNGLKDDGIVGPATWAVIERKPSIPTTTPITTTVKVPTAIQTPKNRKTIKQGVGSKAKPDDDVKYWQTHLGIKPDGIFGSGTTSSTKSYQTKYNLKADGVVGPATWATIGKPVPRPVATAVQIPTAIQTAKNRKTIKQGVGSKAKPDDDVKFWQTHLGIKPDGIFGSGTTSSTKSYQTKYNLKADGVVGPATWATVGKAVPPPKPVVVNVPAAISTTSTAKSPTPKPAPTTAAQTVTTAAKKTKETAKKVASKVSDAAKKVTPEPVKKAADAVVTGTKKLPLWQKIAAGASLAVLGAYGVQTYRTRSKRRAA